MRATLLALLASLSMSVGCLGLPNPQSEWTTSEGGEQRSTVDDSTFSTRTCDCDCDDATVATWNHVHTHFHLAHATHLHAGHHR